MSQISHSIKHRTTAKDVFYTPPSLAERHIEKVLDIWYSLKMNYEPIYLDPCKGNGVYFRQIHYSTEADYQGHLNVEFDIADSEDKKRADGGDFFKHFDTLDSITAEDTYDIICTNPPYSMFNKWIKECARFKPEIISFPVAQHAITPARLEIMGELGYYLHNLCMVKVDKWYGMTYLATWVKQRGCHFQSKRMDCIDYDRTKYHVNEVEFMDED